MSATIDPRIRARRIAVQRDEGRRRLRRLGALAAATGVVASLWGITRTPLLDVDHVVVQGAANTGSGTVQRATGIERGEPLLDVGLAAVASRVADLPWVETADVSRRWPGTVEVRVVERTPVAAAPVRDGGWVLLDASRRQLGHVEEPGPAVLRLELPPVVAEPGRALEAVVPAVLEVAATRPAALEQRLVSLRGAPGDTVEGAVRVPGDGEATVRFGRPTQLASKWLALLAVLDSADVAGVAVIDVRVPSAPALTRR